MGGEYRAVETKVQRSTLGKKASAKKDVTLDFIELGISGDGHTGGRRGGDTGKWRQVRVRETGEEGG